MGCKSKDKSIRALEHFGDRMRIIYFWGKPSLCYLWHFLWIINPRKTENRISVTTVRICLEQQQGNRWGCNILKFFLKYKWYYPTISLIVLFYIFNLFFIYAQSKNELKFSMLQSCSFLILWAWKWPFRLIFSNYSK